jgi:hypothetical protein
MRVDLLLYPTDDTTTGLKLVHKDVGKWYRLIVFVGDIAADTLREQIGAWQYKKRDDPIRSQVT